MSNPSTDKSGREPTPQSVSQQEANPEREQRILDAANTLFLHYGFDKTTVSDIAGQAGVSKGAIYLHFNSKDELFEALLMREMGKYGEIWLTALLDDPAGGTLGSLYQHVLSALNAVPFMRVIFKQDTRVLGNYLHKPDNIFQSMQGRAMRQEMIRSMQKVGAVRADVDPGALAKIMDMLAYGFVHMGENAQPENDPTFEAVFSLIGDMMNRAFTPENADRAAGKAIIRQITREAQATFFNQQTAPERAEQKESVL